MRHLSKQGSRIRIPSLFLVVLLAVTSLLPLHGQTPTTATAKPWTYWWWPASAVSKPDIKAQLERFASKGLGGVHIIPIYGVKGEEKKTIEFLTSDWLSMMEYTVVEAKKLRLGVDMTTGTGWPFGGPNVTEDIAAKKWSIQNQEIVESLTRQTVKRAAPGGAGLVVDPFGKDAMTKYLGRFSEAFSGKTVLPRSMYNDSYEVYGANWTSDFSEQFKKRNGYDLGEKLQLLSDSANSRETQLIRIDYRQTLSDLLLERYARPWTEWSRTKGMLTRYQAHGSPGNLLDLYGAADIPETESFGTSQFQIPGVRVDPDFEEDRFGRPNALAMKFASSAANLTGKPLVSSESTTWLANHFKVSLSQIKPQIDELFVAGINHVFFHGTTYTPESEPFPGWLFYASTNYTKHSHFEPHFQLLNQYIERCQTFLQNSKPDNDLLVYFPMHDVWSKKSRNPTDVVMMDVHHAETWMTRSAFGQLTESLWEKGYTFDYISDLQLSQLDIKKPLIVPQCDFIPESTLNKLIQLAQKGVKIMFVGGFPNSVTGLNQYKDRQNTLQQKIAQLSSFSQNVKVSVQPDDILLNWGIAPEKWASLGLRFIRKIEPKIGTRYFIANLSNSFNSGWIEVTALKGAIERYDPLAGTSEPLPTREHEGRHQVYLNLLPGESCILGPGKRKGGSPARESSELLLGNKWNVSFSSIFPVGLPDTEIKELTSWTALSDSAQFFSGNGTYKQLFDLPVSVLSKKQIVLDLGQVNEVAEVTLNGKALGTAWSVPFRLKIDPSSLKAKNNVIEIKVTNLSANYMRWFDKANPGWKKFYDINIVDITYKPFEAAKWAPMASGLLGPVKLIGY